MLAASACMCEYWWWVGEGLGLDCTVPCCLADVTEFGVGSYC